MGKPRIMVILALLWWSGVKPEVSRGMPIPPGLALSQGPRLCKFAVEITQVTRETFKYGIGKSFQRNLEYLHDNA